MDKNQLRKEYEDLTGKRPFPGWPEEQLIELMEKYKKENGINETVITSPEEGLKTERKEVHDEETELNKEEAERMKEAAAINNREIQTIGEITPVFVKGVPYGIINNEYVPWDEAELIILKAQKEYIEEQIRQKQEETKKQQQ